MNRRLAPRPYFFELFTLANFVLVCVLFYASRMYAGPIPRGILHFAINLLTQAAVGVVIRSVVALVRRQRGYFRVIRSAGWLFDTLRIAFFGGMAVFSYGWLKLVIPIYRPVLFDQQLWDLDQALLGGVAPTILLLDLFSSETVLRAIDWSYANIFMASIGVAFSYFLSSPSRRLRVAFTNGNLLLWTAGAWLYFAVPSLGPAYRFPDVWLAHEHVLQRTQWLQAQLMRNYQHVLRASANQPSGGIQLMFGIAAFPSLHVAFQTFVFLWMRRLWTSGEVLFGIFAFTILLGSMLTGWHYLIDGIAGIALALACYLLSSRSGRISRLLAIRARN